MIERNRKQLRLENFDYNSPGSYFITVCTQKRAPILGRIVGGGALDAPSVELSNAGIVVKKHIDRINLIDAHLTVDKYVIMPNHIHLLFSSENDAAGASPCPTISDVVCSFKSLTTRKCKQAGWNNSVFQTSFHDHIIRNRDDYREIWHYIHTNPQRWKSDEFYTS